MSGVSDGTLARVELMLGHAQTVADKVREGASMIQSQPEVALLLSISADNIETLCDLAKAQAGLIDTMRKAIDRLRGESS